MVRSHCSLSWRYFSTMSVAIERTKGNILFADSTVKYFLRGRGNSSAFAIVCRTPGSSLGRLLRLDPDWLRQRLGFIHHSRVQRRITPGHLKGQFREVHNAPIPAVATQVVRLAHVDAFHRTGIDAQPAEHAFCVVNREPDHSKPLAGRVPLLIDIYTIDRASAGTLVSRDIV